MTRLRLLLRHGRHYELACPPGTPLLGQLARLMAGEAVALEFELSQGGTTIGVSLPPGEVVAVESEPPLRMLASPPAAEAQPAAWLRIPDFLAPEENRAILAYAVGHDADFERSGVDGPEKDHRHSRVLMRPDGLPVDFAGRVREILPEVTRHFGLPLQEGYGFEMQLTAHGDGGYFRLHNDNGSAGTASRYLTYVYYLHREPRPFSGGTLRLYDRSQPRPDSWVPLASFSAFEPENNMIIFFPSGQYHEVLPTLCRGTDFADSRFTLNGWIRPPD
jgi:SM-20-related protein